MSLVGKLEDLGLGEILQIVSLSRKSGLLMIRTVDHVARILFDRGQVVNAVSTAFQVDLGEILSARGLVTGDAIESCRTLQQEEGFTQLLGDILVAERLRIDHRLVAEDRAVLLPSGNLGAHLVHAQRQQLGEFLMALTGLAAQQEQERVDRHARR